MIRHGNSLLISIIVHSLLLLTLLFAWKNYSVVEKDECEKKISLNLHNLVEEKEVVQEKKAEVKNIEDVKEKKIIETEKKEKPKEVKKQKEAFEKKIEKKEVVSQEKKVIEKPKVQEPKKIEDIEDSVKKEKVLLKESVVEEAFTKKEPVLEKKEEIQKEDLKSKQDKLLQEYLEINRQKIVKLLSENLYYPRSARKRNITGLIVVKFTLGVDAKVYNIEVVESQSNILSRAAIKTIEDLSGVFPAPKEKLVLNVPINYDLSH